MPRFSDGTLTALKWLGLLLMTAGHVDWMLYDSTLGIHTGVGRLSFPLFGFVFGYNLARPSFTSARVPKVLLRLGVFAIVTAPLYAYLVGQWFPLNIIATMYVVVLVLWFAFRGWWIAGALVALWLGVIVDYSWPGLAYMLAVCWAYRSRHPLGAIAIGAALASLVVINGNWNALWAIPVLWAASYLDLNLPRAQWAFYAYYFGHLVVLAALFTVGVGV